MFKYFLLACSLSLLAACDQPFDIRNVEQESQNENNSESVSPDADSELDATEKPEGDKENSDDEQALDDDETIDEPEDQPVDGNPDENFDDAFDDTKPDAGQPPVIEQGQLAGFSGLQFESGQTTGVTNAQGEFQYEDNQPLVFTIGDIAIAQTQGAATLNLAQLAITEHVEANLKLFLQALDDDADPSNGIQIIEAIHAQAAGMTVNFDQTPEAFKQDGNVQTIVSELTNLTSAGARPLVPQQTNPEPIPEPNPTPDPTGKLQSNGKTFLVLEETPPITTHSIKSGAIELGISDQGGGYINMVKIPGKGDIMRSRSDGYGRGGQVAIRDSLHGGKYNPTMAGFTDRAGSRVEILFNEQKMVIPARPSSMWNGDGKYDYTQWENLAADPYKNDGGNKDVDGVNEASLKGKQADEVTSEFDYYGEYENCISQSGGVPCFRVYFEYRFVRLPGTAMRQFDSKSGLVAKALFNENLLGKDLSNQQPKGSHPATEYDLSGLIWALTMRADTAVWYPEFRMMLGADGKWQSQKRDNNAKVSAFKNTDIKPLLVLSDDGKADQGLAYGLYMPHSDINVYDIVGRRLNDHQEVYKDKRQSQKFVSDTPARASGLQKFGFGFRGRGILNPDNTPAGVYETLRGEMYLIFGTPNEIKTAANKIKAL